MFFSQEKDPDVTDRYGFTVDSEWLSGESITAAIFTPPVESGLTITNVSLLDSPTISALFSGGVEGFWPIHIRIETATRQREFTITLWIKDN